jgi:hypothetical protein
VPALSSRVRPAVCGARSGNTQSAARPRSMKPQFRQIVLDASMDGLTVDLPKSQY